MTPLRLLPFSPARSLASPARPARRRPAACQPGRAAAPGAGGTLRTWQLARAALRPKGAAMVAHAPTLPY